MEHLQSREAEAAEKRWLQHVHDVYPDRHTRTYFLPPLFFRRVPHTSTPLHGEAVRKLSPPAAPSGTKAGRRRRGRQREREAARPTVTPQVAGTVYTAPQQLPDCFVQDSDLQDEAAHEWVLRHLKELALAQNDVMMVISHLGFLKYLGIRSNPQDDAAIAHLPRAGHVDPSMRQGDFDLLIIHLQYGLMVGEVKSVQKVPGQSGAEFLQTVVRRVDKAVAQLNKAEAVVKTLISDICSPPTVTKLLVLPSVTSRELREAMATDGTVSQAMQACVHTHGVREAVARCLLSDQLSPQDVPIDQQAVSRLRSWWSHLHPQRAAMTHQLYDRLLARFCGPATAVEIPTVMGPHKVIIKTTGQSVAETGLQFSILALYPAQLLVLQSGERRVFLTGPPGTGKTVVLALRARQWALDGQVVHVVSTHYKGRAVSALLQQQVLRARTRGRAVDASMVRTHNYDFDDTSKNDVGKAVSDLSQCAVGGELFVIVDEVGSTHRGRFGDFCRKLLHEVPSVSLWAADMKDNDIPDCLQREEMTTMLRCPPVIHREVGRSDLIGVNSPKYSSTPGLSPTDGPDVIWLSHRGAKGHTEGQAQNCPECGKQIADVLHRQLRIGQPDAGGLEYRDVLIIYYNPDDEQPSPPHALASQPTSSTASESQSTSSKASDFQATSSTISESQQTSSKASDFQTTSYDSSTSETTPAESSGRHVTSLPPGLVEGLRSSDVPLTVLRRHDTQQAYRDVALAVHNTVTVSPWQNVSGLERRVVVSMGEIADYERFYVMSRCTAQLIWIDNELHGTGGSFT